MIFNNILKNINNNLDKINLVSILARQGVFPVSQSAGDCISDSQRRSSVIDGCRRTSSSCQDFQRGSPRIAINGNGLRVMDRSDESLSFESGGKGLIGEPRG